MGAFPPLTLFSPYFTLYYWKNSTNDVSQHQNEKHLVVFQGDLIQLTGVLKSKPDNLQIRN